MTVEKEAKASLILRGIGYDGGNITQTEMWIALELEKKHREDVDRLEKLVMQIFDDRLRLMVSLWPHNDQDAISRYKEHYTKSFKQMHNIK